MSETFTERHLRLDRARRERELEIGLAFGLGAMRCISVSPQSSTPCRLPDREDFHDAGHEGWDGPSSSVSWPTTADEHARWEAS